MDGNLLRFRKDVRYCWVDCETFNLALSFQQNRFWQIACLEVVGEEIVDTLDIRVNWPDAPHLKIGAGAAMVTRYNQQEHDKVAINADLVFPKVWAMLKRADYVCYHNGLNFDLYLLKGWAEMMGEDWKWIVPKSIDTKALAQGIKMGIKYNPQKDDFLEYQYRLSAQKVKGIKTNLAQCAKDYGIASDPEKYHEALYDLEINKMVFDKMKYQIEL